MARTGELEALVMQCLWDRDEPMSVRQVLDQLLAGRQVAYTTVMTVMDRLHRKGVLDREEDGKAYLYTPRSSRADHTARAMADALPDRGGERTAALVHFADYVSPEEAQALWEALERRRSRPPSGARHDDDGVLPAT